MVHHHRVSHFDHHLHHHHQQPSKVEGGNQEQPQHAAATSPELGQLQLQLIPAAAHYSRECCGGVAAAKRHVGGGVAAAKRHVGGGSGSRNARHHHLRFVSVFTFVSLVLFLAPRLLFPASPPSGGDAFDHQSVPDGRAPTPPPPCSGVGNNTICCDRTSFRTDVCIMRGDVRTHSPSSTIFLNLPNATEEEQRIRPYTRKWETSVMETIDELRLRISTSGAGACDVKHDVPAVVFSTGGYTGNLYHEFNDGLLPLYITAGHFNKQVVFVILEYHDWWITKYGDVLSRLSDHPPIDFSSDNRTHCFPEAIVGLRIHDKLAVDPSRMPGGEGIGDFRRILDEAYRPRIMEIAEGEQKSPAVAPAKRDRKPKLVIVSRKGSREIENEGDLAREAEEVGFRVKILRPTRSTELAKIYRAMNSCDAMIGVHGAAMTHFLFMRPRSVFVQIVPLGTDWAAEEYYGGPARKIGLRYVGYKVLPPESSLSRRYGEDDPVLRDPESVNARGWEVTKKVYLDGQNVRLDLRRFRKRLAAAHRYLVSGGGRAAAARSSPAPLLEQKQQQQRG